MEIEEQDINKTAEFYKLLGTLDKDFVAKQNDFFKNMVNEFLQPKAIHLVRQMITLEYLSFEDAQKDNFGRFNHIVKQHTNKRFDPEGMDEEQDRCVFDNLASEAMDIIEEKQEIVINDSFRRRVIDVITSLGLLSEEKEPPKKIDLKKGDAF